MTPTPHTIVISPGTKLVTIPSSPEADMEFSGNATTNLPKYAVGLFESNGNGPRKRKRLTHLTPEEKIMRRKLKNRVAAQTARDRKRMRMETLEDTVLKVQKQAQLLLDVNKKLVERTEALERENAELRSRLGLESESNTTACANRQTVEKIKVEFESISDIPDTESFPVSVPESILSPDESSDEVDSHQGNGSSFVATEKEALSRRLAKVECVSPEPAVFGEHENRLNPQQQEAVNHSLIHSAVAMTISPASIPLETTPRTTSLDCSSKSILVSTPTGPSKCQSAQAAALDLTTRQTA